MNIPIPLEDVGGVGCSRSPTSPMETGIEFLSFSIFAALSHRQPNLKSCLENCGVIYKLKLHCLIICCMFFISLYVAATYAMDFIIVMEDPDKPHVTDSNNKPTVMLVGDSIVDNGFHLRVGRHTTGQVLVNRLNPGLNENGEHVNGEHVTIDDRSTEEATTASVLEALEGDGYITIPDHGCVITPDDGDPIVIRESYVIRRENSGVAYDSTSASSARLSQYCRINAYGLTQVDIRSDIQDSYVVVSLGGNDPLLDWNFKFYEIVANLKKIAAIYKSLGAKKVIYIIPYQYFRHF